MTTPVTAPSSPADRLPERRARPTWFVVLLLLGVASGWFGQSLARHGLITSPDSVVYEGTAANLQAGRGLTAPITTVGVDVSPDRAVRLHGAVPLVQFPPLFPAALALLGRFGLSPPDAAKVLNPSLLGVNVFLTGLLVVALVGRRRWAWSLPVIALMLAGVPRFERTPLLILHGSVLSEPLLITFVLSSLLAVILARRHGSTAWLLIAMVLAGMATATRFVGVAMVLVIVLAALTSPTGTRAGRWAWAALAALIGIGPTVAVVAIEVHRLHGHGHPLTFGSPVDAIRQLASGVTQWFVPLTATTAARAAVLAGVVVVVAVASSQQLRLGDRRGEWWTIEATRGLVATLAAVYLLVVLASRLVFDQNVALWGRHLELAWILVLVLITTNVATAVGTTGSRLGLLALALAVSVAIAAPGISDMSRVIRLGYRPLDVRPTTSPRFVAAVRAVPEQALVFSNVPEGAYLAAGRSALMVPCEQSYYTHDANPHYAEDLAQMQALVRSGRAVLVLDDESPAGADSCFDGRDAAAAGMRKVGTWADGGVYRSR